MSFPGTSTTATSSPPLRRREYALPVGLYFFFGLAGVGVGSCQVSVVSFFSSFSCVYEPRVL